MLFVPQSSIDRLAMRTAALCLIGASFSMAACAQQQGTRGAAAANGQLSASSSPAASATPTAAVTHATAVTAVTGSVPVVELDTAKGKLGAQLATQIATARKAGLTPFVELTASWCHSCKALAAVLGDSIMTDAFAGTYIIRLDMDAWNSQLTGFNLMVPSIPTFFAIDETGKGTVPLSGDVWGDDLPGNMAPPLKKFFQTNMRKQGSK